MNIARKINKALSAEAFGKHRSQLQRDYSEILEFQEADMFVEFSELDVIVNSSDFINRRRQIERLSYKKSEICHDEKLFKSLSSNKKIITYLRVKDSDIFNEYTSFSNSELHVELNGIKDAKPKDLSQEDKERMSRYFLDEKIKALYEFEKSKDYRIYKEIENSQILREYCDIREKAQTDDFIKERDFLLNKDRYKTTNDYALLKKYNDYLGMEVVKKYLKYKDTDSFNFIQNWDLSFEDSFNDGKLDPKKWTCVVNRAKDIMNSNFSLDGDRHFFTDGGNISLRGNKLCITTKQEDVEGVRFDSSIGFKKEMFKYSSGIISSQGLFSQKYGKFEAKIKFGNMAVNQCFWLSGENSVPHIDIVKTQSHKKALCSLIAEKSMLNSEKVNKIDFTKDFYIFTLIWLPNKIEWKINDIVVWEQIENIPSEPMSLFFANTLYKDFKNEEVNMCVDWVKVYELAQE